MIQNDSRMIVVDAHPFISSRDFIGRKGDTQTRDFIGRKACPNTRFHWSRTPLILFGRPPHFSKFEDGQQHHRGH